MVMMTCMIKRIVLIIIAKYLEWQKFFFHGILIIGSPYKGSRWLNIQSEE